MRTGNQDFHWNDLGGNGKSISLRELFGLDHGNDICAGTGINPNSREILREFSRGLPCYFRALDWGGYIIPKTTKKKETKKSTFLNSYMNPPNLFRSVRGVDLSFCGVPSRIHTYRNFARTFTANKD